MSSSLWQRQPAAASEQRGLTAYTLRLSCRFHRFRLRRGRWQWCMVILSRRLQFLIRPGWRIAAICVATAAGKLKPNLRQNLPIFIKLTDLVRINSRHVRAHVAAKTRCVRYRALDQARHVAVNAIYAQARVSLHLFHLRLFIMAPFTRCPRRWRIGFFQLVHAIVGIMAGHARNDGVFAREQIGILIMMLDKPILHDRRFDG